MASHAAPSDLSGAPRVVRDSAPKASPQVVVDRQRPALAGLPGDDHRARARRPRALGAENRFFEHDAGAAPAPDAHGPDALPALDAQLALEVDLEPGDHV